MKLDNPVIGATLTTEALMHSSTCQKILEHDSLRTALAYCIAQKIEPPRCSLTADSESSEVMRDRAMRMLSDYGWWMKRLRLKAARASEIRRIRGG